MDEDFSRSGKLYSLPGGVQDYLPEECYNKGLVTDRLLDEFRLWGYDRLETAEIGYYDHYQGGESAIDQRRMFKMTDRDGNLIVLSPDITLPIARLAVTKLKDSYPLRLCYSGKVYDAGEAKFRVQQQAGVELLGVSGTEADFEAISLAVTALRSVGLADFKIDIGQVEYFKGLMGEFGLNEEQSERVRQLVDKKNMLGVELMLKEIAAPTGAHEAIQGVPALFGGREVIARARECCGNKVSVAALENLERVYDLLADAGLEEYISIDLGMVQRISYYSGIVFRGLSRYLGAPLLVGGRYDGLAACFGRQLPATGFAVDVKKLLVALEYQNVLKPLPGVDAAVASAGSERFTFEYLSRLRRAGKRSVRVYLREDELADYCAQNAIPEGIAITADDEAVKIYG